MVAIREAIMQAYRELEDPDGNVSNAGKYIVIWRVNRMGRGRPTVTSSTGTSHPDRVT